MSEANNRIARFQILLNDALTALTELNDLCPGEGVFYTASWGLIMTRWMFAVTQHQRDGDYKKTREVISWMEEGIRTMREELEKLLMQTDELQGGAEEAAETADWIMSEILDRGKKQ